jgi:hypothetical protein
MPRGEAGDGTRQHLEAQGGNGSDAQDAAAELPDVTGYAR